MSFQESVEHEQGRAERAMGCEIERSIQLTADEPSYPAGLEEGIALARHPIGKAIYDMVSRNDPEAHRSLIRKIKLSTYHIPPFDPGDKESAADEHLWKRVLKKTGNNPQPEIVLQVAIEGKFEPIPYEVKMGLIDDARKESAQKRGGDGKHLPRFEALTGDGELAREPDDDFGDTDEQRGRPTGSRIEHQSREVWHHVIGEIQRRELASDPRIDTELGPAAKLLRFYLEHLDDVEHWTAVEIAQELGVTDRTIRNYRRRVKRFVEEHFGVHSLRSLLDRTALSPPRPALGRISVLSPDFRSHK